MKILTSTLAGTVSLDGGGLRDTVEGQILAHPFTAGVSLVSYGNINSISGVPGAGGANGPFFLTSDLTSVWGAGRWR
ncbi:MAG: hypothetical protein QNK04_06040 [Myxococcota bacterium]|nr:hypothetical protein [Myxococcota bacterium]